MENEEDDLTPQKDVEEENYTSSFQGVKGSTENILKQKAELISQEYTTRYQRRFKWLPSTLFDVKKLKKDLLTDAEALINVLENIGEWKPSQDEKINNLLRLLTKTHPHEKVLIFTQFADSVRYITENLQANNIANIAGVTGRFSYGNATRSQNPTELTARFSPVSNGKRDSAIALLLYFDLSLGIT